MSDLIMNSSYLVLPKAADIRGARAYLGWTQMELAYRCGTSAVTITSIEKEKSRPSKELLEKIAHIFMAEDIYFHPDGGYKVEKSLVKVYKGVEGFLEVLEDVIKVCGPDKQEVLFLGNDDSRSDDTINEMHKKIYEIGIPYKFLIAEDSDYILGPLEEYRKVDANFFLSKDATLIYGDKVLLISKDSDPLHTAKSLLIKDEGVFEQFKRYFYHLWNNGKKPLNSSAKQIFFRK